MTFAPETPRNRIPNTAGIVLCGGQSNRMGMPKAWLPCGSETMLQRVVRLISDVCSPIVAVSSEGQSLPPLDPQVVVVHDRTPDQGPLEGLAVGFNAIGHSAKIAMVVACDVPLLRTTLVQHLVHCLTGYDAAVPLIDGRPHPLVAVYHERVRETLARQLHSGQLSMRDFLGEINVRYVEGDALKTVDPSLESLRNINRPEEYRALVRQLGFDIPGEFGRAPD